MLPVHVPKVVFVIAVAFQVQGEHGEVKDEEEVDEEGGGVVFPLEGHAFAARAQAHACVHVFDPLGLGFGGVAQADRI